MEVGWLNEFPFMIYTSVLLLKVVCLTAITAELVAWFGAGFLSWCHRGTLSVCERIGAGTLLGFGVLGTAYLGLAAVGLFAPALLVGALLVPAAFARRRGARGWAMPRMIAGWCRAAGSPGAWLVGAGLLTTVPHLVLLDTNIDVWCYHSGMPWAYLQAHRLLLERVPGAYHISLPVDLTYALGMIAGEDRLAKGIQVICFLAATAIWAGPGASGVGVWLGPLLALATGHMEECLGWGKNDLAAAAMLVGGAGLVRRGGWGAGGWLLGMCAAAKVVNVPVIAIWAAIWRPPLRRWAAVLPALALPSACWWAKEWIATGHPTASFVASRILPAFDWGPHNQAAYVASVQGFWPADTLKATLWPGAWVRYMKMEHLPLLLLLPGLAVLGRGRVRQSAIGLAAGTLLTLGTAGILRYMFAGVWTLAALIGAEAVRLPARARRLGVFLLAAVSLARIAVGTDLWGLPWAAMLGPGSDARLLTTYGEAAAWLGELQAPRVLDVAEIRTYRLPGRVVYTGGHGETPLIWQLAKESASEARLGIKFRQLGATLLLYNYISADWLATRYATFLWDARMIAMYRSYALGHFELVRHSEGNDFVNGGFCLMRIRRAPLVPRPATIWFLPGTESLFAGAIQLEHAGRLRDTVAECEALMALMPGVGHVWNVAGHAYALVGDSARAYACLDRFGAMTDQLNQPELGWASLRMGHVDKAEHLLLESLPRYPSQTPTINLNLALVRQQRAANLLARGSPRDVEEQLEIGDRFLALVPEQSPNPALAESRRRVQATQWALKGEVHRMKGEDSRMAACLREALRISPDDPMAARWKGEIERVEPHRFSLGGPR